ncbi:hypothetical protein ABZ807_14530 [Micromonospora sp. NPDC047548]|uniref:hypothetical protein n=1 Tax=Micromonospora sp. NPDC047548 TaxID=3155624 RepID=UPI0033ECB745
MTELERRYLRLLRAYPADYRRARGTEIVGTYLDLAGPERRWPSSADAADLVRGGLRQRLRAAAATDLIPGVRLAAVLAFYTAVTLAGIWAGAATYPAPAELGHSGTFGPFGSAGAIAWVGWLVAAVVVAIAPGRPGRVAVVIALALTLAVIPIGAHTGPGRPPLFVLLPQIALGVVALALPDRLPAPVRYTAPALGGAAVALMAVALTPGEYWGYEAWAGARIVPAAGVILLLAALLLGAGLALRQDLRGVWATLVLLTPVGLLSLRVIAGAVGGLRDTPNPSWGGLAATAVAVTLLGPAVLPLAVAIRRRVGRQRPADVRCPTCGAHR